MKMGRWRGAAKPITTSIFISGSSGSVDQAMTAIRRSLGAAARSGVGLLTFPRKRTPSRRRARRDQLPHPALRMRQAPACGAVVRSFPKLNPACGVWKYCKRVELADGRCSNLATLELALRRAKERLRLKRAVSQASLTQAGCQA